jgi:hypothetical protein
MGWFKEWFRPASATELDKILAADPGQNYSYSYSLSGAYGYMDAVGSLLNSCIEVGWPITWQRTRIIDFLVRVDYQATCTPADMARLYREVGKTSLRGQ